jgi:hypothetical protein
MIFWKRAIRDCFAHLCGLPGIMETSLHRELKEIYADGHARLEAPVEGFRIDVLCGEQLVEIQHGSLAAIRDKIARLVQTHRVLVVKPLVVRKTILKQDAKGGRVVSRRLSPKRGSVLDLFHELVYFTRVFPHRHLSLEVPLVDIEEWRYPGHGRRRRRRQGDFQVEDQRLVAIRQLHQFRTGRDLAGLIPAELPSPFHTGHLAQLLGIDRWFAQRIAYCFRKMDVTEEVGKKGNARLYRFPRRVRAAA